MDVGKPDADVGSSSSGGRSGNGSSQRSPSPDLTIVSAKQESQGHIETFRKKSKWFSELYDEEDIGTDHTVDLTWLESCAVEVMVNFMNGDLRYLRRMMETQSLHDIFVAHVHTWHLANQLGIPELSNLVIETWPRVVERSLQLPEFPRLVSLVYNLSTPVDTSIRNFVVAISARYIDFLVQNGDFVELLQQTPRIAADIIQFQCQENPVRSYRCNNCRQHTISLSAFDTPYCSRCGGVRTRVLVDWDQSIIEMS